MNERLPTDPDLPEPPARRLHPEALVAVATGGALGTLARYEVGRALTTRPGGWPLAILTVNLTGAFLLGAVLVVVRSPRLRPLLATGFLGAYTTMSTLAVDTDLLVRDGRALTAFAYLAVSLVGGVLAARGGIAAGRLVTRREAS
jgi:fluoride exporter